MVRRVALVNATVMTATKGVIENGTILIGDSIIEAIGTNVHLPKNTDIWKLKGKTIMPGMIDAHTHLGLRQDGVGPEQSDEDEVENPIAPHIRAIDAINPEDIGFRDALKAGVTTVGVMPGSYNIVCGQTAAVKVVGKTLEDMLVSSPIGMKISFGERPKSAYGARKRSPMTRMGIAALLREALVKTQNYMKRKGERDLRMESMVPVMKGAIPLRAHAHRADDIMTAVRIAREFSLRLIIEHGTDGYKVAPELSTLEIPVVHGPWIKVRGNLEQSGRNPESPRILIESGVLTCFSTDHPVIAIQNMRLQATAAVEEGVSEAEALKAVTINSARIMSIDKRVGSLERGKDADLVILSGPPFAAGSCVEVVIVNGAIAWKR